MLPFSLPDALYYTLFRVQQPARARATLAWL
jgi:hypothetical protein